jgi:DNA-binding protein HU-beta/integration host factor subunit alpha
MTKRELVMRIAKETGLIQTDVKGVIQKTLDYVVEALAKKDTVELRNFGVFQVKHRKARIGRNPNKPQETVSIPAKNIAIFKAGKKMKELVEKSV